MKAGVSYVIIIFRIPSQRIAKLLRKHQIITGNMSEGDGGK